MSALESSPGFLPAMIIASTSSLVTSVLFTVSTSRPCSITLIRSDEIEHVVDVVADEEDADALGLQLRDELADLVRLRRARAPRSARP